MPQLNTSFFFWLILVTDANVPPNTPSGTASWILAGLADGFSSQHFHGCLLSQPPLVTVLQNPPVPTTLSLVCQPSLVTFLCLAASIFLRCQWPGFLDISSVVPNAADQVPSPGNQEPSPSPANMLFVPPIYIWKVGYWGFCEIALFSLLSSEEVVGCCDCCFIPHLRVKNNEMASSFSLTDCGKANILPRRPWPGCPSLIVLL